MQDDYKRNLEIVNSCCVVNNAAERAVQTIELYNGKMTKDKDQTQYVLQCVEHHRKVYSIGSLTKRAKDRKCSLQYLCLC